MINALTGLGYGIIGLAVLLGVGIVILSILGSSVASCPTGYAYNANSSGYVFSTNKCCLASTPSCNAVGTNSTSASTATQTMNSVVGYLGTSNGGLASWIPIVIVLVIGMLFLGAFLTRKGRSA